MPSRDWAHLCLYVDVIQQKQFSLAPEALDIAGEQKNILNNRETGEKELLRFPLK